MTEVVARLTSIGNLCTLRLCDEEDVEDLKKLIFSINIAEYAKIYSEATILADFDNSECQWYALELNGPDELLLICVRLVKSDGDLLKLQVFIDKTLDSLESKSLIISYFIVQAQSLSYNLQSSGLAIEIPAENESFVKLLEQYKFFESGGYFCGSSMIVQYRKLFSVSSLSFNAENENGIMEMNFVESNEDSSQMKSIIEDLFRALHQSSEFKLNSEVP